MYSSNAINAGSPPLRAAMRNLTVKLQNIVVQIVMSSCCISYNPKWSDTAVRLDACHGIHDLVRSWSMSST